MKQVERRRKSKKGGREAASWELRNLKFQVEKGESKRKVRRGGGGGGGGRERRRGGGGGGGFHTPGRRERVRFHTQGRENAYAFIQE